MSVDTPLLAVEWTGVDDVRRRIQIIPDVGLERDGWRIEHEHRDGAWREAGREPITDVVVDCKRGSASSTTVGP